MSDGFSRDPGDWEYTKHLKQRIRRTADRQIAISQIEWAISKGKVDEDLPVKSHQIAFIQELPVDLIVIADPRDMKIVTAFYSDEQGAAQGVI